MRRHKNGILSRNTLRPDLGAFGRISSAGRSDIFRSWQTAGSTCGTCALSLKLSEIDLVKKVIGHRPVLMMDDVLSELDSGRQNYLLSTIGGIQTFITCTGLDEFVNNRFKIDQVFRIESGTCVEKSDIHN